MLTLTELEPRDNPAPWVGIGVIQPDHITGDPGGWVRIVQGDNPHTEGVSVELPGNGRFIGVWVNP